VSDDLDMKAVAHRFTQPGTVAQTFNAGCDLLIISRNINSSAVEGTYHIAADFAKVAWIDRWWKQLGREFSAY